MIQPLLSHDALLADIAAARKDKRFFHLWWLGQSGFLLQWEDRHLLLDPYLSDSLTRKYANTDKPHVRMTELVIDPRKLDFIDVVTSSHSHSDHFDVETLRPLVEVNPKLKLVVPTANREQAIALLGLNPDAVIGLDDRVSAEVADFEITGIASAHEQLDCDAAGRHKYLGYVVRFGPYTLYHSGDTVRYEGLVERLQRFAIDVALLPINGHLPERRVAGNLSGREAAALAKAIDPWLVIPCHYEMFEFNTVSPAEFLAEAARLEVPARALRCGERWSGEELRVE